MSPHFPLRTWEDCRLCWEAKGFKLDSITLELMKVGKYGRSTIGKLMNTTRDAPPEVIEMVWSLELVPGASKHKYDIYLRGLEAVGSLGSTPPESVRVQSVDVEALAASVADKVVARVPSPGEIADEVSARVPGASGIAAQLSTVGSQIAALSREIDAKLPPISAQVDRLDTLTRKTEGRLDTLGGKVEATSAKLEGRLEGLGGKLDTTTARIDGALGALGVLGDKVEAAASKTQAALGSLGVEVEAASAKTAEALGAVGAKVEAASAKTGGQLTELAAQVGDAGHTLQLVHAQQGGMDRRMRRLGQALWGLSFVVALGFSTLALVAWRNGTLDLNTRFFHEVVPGIHGEMGEPKTGEPMPDHPLPGQSRPPCHVGAIELSGGCWIQVANQVPPCTPGLYFRGNACYVRVSP